VSTVTTERLAAVARERAPVGAVAGALAWLAGYAAAVEAARRLFGSPNPAWGAFLFYDVHLVPLTPVGGVTRAGGNAVVRMFGPVGLVGGVVPACLLVVAGGVVAWRANARSLRAGAVAGAAVTAGYLPLSVLGALVSTERFFGGVYHPELLATAAVAGVAFPVVFGGIGGVVAARV
jgi:hypothetical protein